MTTKTNKFIQYLLWASLLLALAGSASHVAWGFAGMASGNLFWGWVQALAVDLGMLGLALGIQQRKRAGQRTFMLWLGVAVFALASVYANLLYGYAHMNDVELTSVPTWLLVARPWIMAAILPVLVLWLSEVAASDMEHARQIQEKAEKAEQRKQRLEQPEFNTTGSTHTVLENGRNKAIQQKQSDKHTAKQQMLEILTNTPNIPITTLSNELSRNRSTIYQYGKELVESGELSGALAMRFMPNTEQPSANGHRSTF